MYARESISGTVYRLCNFLWYKRKSIVAAVNLLCGIFLSSWSRAKKAMTTMVARNPENIIFVLFVTQSCGFICKKIRILKFVVMKKHHRAVVGSCSNTKKKTKFGSFATNMLDLWFLMKSYEVYLKNPRYQQRLKQFIKFPCSC
jgi:hypothetical protein